MNLNEFINKLMQRVKNEGFEAEVCVENGENINIYSQNSVITSQSANTIQSVSFKALINGKMAYSLTEAIDDNAIDMLINSVKACAQVLSDEDQRFIYEGAKEYPQITNFCDVQQNINVEDFKNTIESLNQSFLKADSRISKVIYCGIDFSKQTIQIVNTKGMNLSHSRQVYTIACDVFAQNENGISTAFEIRQNADFNKINQDELISTLVDRVVNGLNAEPIKSGQYDIVFNNNAMKEFLDCFSSVFSAESVQKGLSQLKGKEGEIIASECLSIIDDPLMPNGIESTPFDAEGYPTSTKYIIENGKLNTVLHNLKTANKAGIKSTGNASASGVRSFNMYIKAGNISLDEMLEQIGECVVITEFQGLHSGANQVSGDFSLAAKGYLVKNGKTESAVEQITVASNFYTVLKQIKLIANDIKFNMDSFGSPSVFVGKLSIAGK